MKFSKLVEHVSKKPIPPHVRSLTVEIMASDEQGEDVEVCNHLLMCLNDFQLQRRCRSLL